MTAVFQFDPTEERLVRVPESFFTRVIPQSQDTAVQQICLFSFWLLEIQERNPQYLIRADFTAQETIRQAFQQKGVDPEQTIANALEKTVQAGILIQVNLAGKNEQSPLYFINSPRGRAAATALANGDWSPDWDHLQPVHAAVEKANIFKLYEDHIGPLTPLMAEFLQDAEQTYPMAWIREAFEIAVSKNVRNWRYVEAILKRWQEKGKDGESRQNTEKSWQKYLEGDHGES